MAKDFQMQFRKAYDEFAPGYVSPGAYVDNSGEVLTEQSDADRCDINKIVERFIRTGLIEGNHKPGDYGDFSEVVDYHDALNKVQLAEDGFMQLDAKVRARFDNDPGKFLDFFHDASNEKEAYEMGLFKEGYVPSWQAAEGSAQAAEQPETRNSQAT